MNKQLYKNSEYTKCKAVHEYNALRCLIEQDGWSVCSNHEGYERNENRYGIRNDEFRATGMGTFIPQSEMFFRGAPEWATLFVLSKMGEYAWLEHNSDGVAVSGKFVGDTAHFTSDADHEWHKATVIARRDIKSMTREQKRAHLLAQLAALDEHPPLASMLKPTTTLPDLIEARTLAAWVAQEAPDWNGEDSFCIWLADKWFLEPSHLSCFGSVRMPRKLADLLCEKLNRKEWTI